MVEPEFAVCTLNCYVNTTSIPCFALCIMYDTENMINIITSCDYFLQVFLMNWNELLKIIPFPLLLCLTGSSACNYLHIYCTSPYSPLSPPAPTPPPYIFLIGLIILHLFSCCFFLFVTFNKSHLKSFLERERGRVCLKQRMTESIEKDLPRESRLCLTF